MKRTFIYTDDKSNKFWSIDINGAEFTVTFGKVGTAGQTQTKSFATEVACQKEADKLIREKTNKDYVEQVNSPTKDNKQATGKEQKYVPADVTDFDRIMSPMRWDSDKEEEVESFIGYYEENCTKPYALVDDNCVSFVWTDPENADKKHSCTITPSVKTILFQPLDGDKVKIKISDELLSTIENEMKLWGLTVSPFKPAKVKKAAVVAKSRKMGTVKIQGNPNAAPISMPKNLKICCKDTKRGHTWDITANYHEKNGVYAGSTYKKKFATPEEAVIDLIKVGVSVSTYPRLELVYISDCKDENTKYSLDSMKQLVYQYMQAKSPSNATELELPIFDPEDDAAIYIEAIKVGDAALVKEFLLAGANPTDCKIKNKNSYPFETAIEHKHADVATVLTDHYKALGKEVPDWMLKEIKSIS